MVDIIIVFQKLKLERFSYLYSCVLEHR